MPPEGYPAAEKTKYGHRTGNKCPEMPVVVIATQNGLYEKVLSNIQEIKARKGKVIALVTKGDTVISKIADTCIELPETIECLDPLITTVPLQVTGSSYREHPKGLDVDQPRNLAKTRASAKVTIRTDSRVTVLGSGKKSDLQGSG